MLQSIKGVCRDGRVELLEPPPPGAEGQVIVTFLGSESVDLAAGSTRTKPPTCVIASGRSLKIGTVPKWMSTMAHNRGDVVLVLFPDSNFAPAKHRPALIVQANALQTGLHQTIVAMISSNMTRAGHPCRVTVLQASSEGRQMGLRTDSIVMTDNLATVREEEIDRAIGSCPVMDRVAAALRYTLGI